MPTGYIAVDPYSDFTLSTESINCVDRLTRNDRERYPNQSQLCFERRIAVAYLSIACPKINPTRANPIPILKILNCWEPPIAASGIANVAIIAVAT